MKIKLFLISLGFCAYTSVWAQALQTKTKAPAKQETATPDSLAQQEETFVVDEQALEASLKKLALELKAKKAKQTAQQMQLLRYQMLINLLSKRAIPFGQVQQAPQQQPVIININNSQTDKERKATKPAVAPKQESSQKPVVAVQKPAVDSTTLLMKKRLAFLEARLLATEKKLAEVDTAQRNTIFIHQKRAKAVEPVVVKNDSTAKVAQVILPQAQVQQVQASNKISKIDSLARRLKALEEKEVRLNKALEENNEAEIRSIVEEIEEPRVDSVLVIDTVELIKSEVQEVAVPVDFQRSVFFSINSTKLTPLAKAILGEVVQFMNEFSQAKVEITGYASADGNKTANIRLASHRQESVRAYLQAQGISSERLTIGASSIDKDVVAEPLGRKVVVKLTK